jgi:hypothetical protein
LTYQFHCFFAILLIWTRQTNCRTSRRRVENIIFAVRARPRVLVRRQDGVFGIAMPLFSTTRCWCELGAICSLQPSTIQNIECADVHINGKVEYLFYEKPEQIPIALDKSTTHWTCPKICLQRRKQKKKRQIINGTNTYIFFSESKHLIVTGASIDRDA